MNNQPAQRSRRGLYLIGATLLGILVIIIVAGLISVYVMDDPDSEDTFEPEQDDPAQTGCWFTPGEDPVTAYESADLDSAAQDVDGSLQYPIREVDGDALGLELRDGTRVWIGSDAGAVVGECEEFDIEPNPINALE